MLNDYKDSHTQDKNTDDGLRVISREEVDEHSRPLDLWVIIDNKVYDLTKFQLKHPGGKSVLQHNAGRDATEKWILAGHSPKAREQMKEYVIGKIDENEQIKIDNPMHKGTFSKVFPYVTGLLFIVFCYYCIRNTELHLDKPSDTLGLLFGAGPSLFLILAGLKLWPGTPFRTHRIGGLGFLVQYALCWYFFFTDYDWFKTSPFVWTLVLNGVTQATSAIIEVGPTLEWEDNSEYFGNKGTMSRQFIQENLFYHLLTTFSSLYYYPQFYNALQSNIIGKAIEITFVFLPYILIRPLFPKTRLRDALANEKIKTDDHRVFYFISTWIIKLFVLGGKHYIGLFTNTIRYLGGLNTKEVEKLLQFMMLANAGTVAIGPFLHTLRFKNKLAPKVSMTIYLMFLYTPLIAVIQLIPYYYPYWKMFIIFTGGFWINFLPPMYFQAWTLTLTAWFVSYKNGLLPSEAENYVY